MDFITFENLRLLIIDIYDLYRKLNQNMLKLAFYNSNCSKSKPVTISCPLMLYSTIKMVKTLLRWSDCRKKILTSLKKIQPFRHSYSLCSENVRTFATIWPSFRWFSRRDLFDFIFKIWTNNLDRFARNLVFYNIKTKDKHEIVYCMDYG